MHLASALGLSSSMGKGTWNGYGHVWAVVNGKNFDTTAFQHGYGWTSPKVQGYAGSPKATVGKNEIKIDMRGSQISGINDLEYQMKKVADEAFAKLMGKNLATGV